MASGPNRWNASSEEGSQSGLMAQALGSRLVPACHVEGGRHTVRSHVHESLNIVDVAVGVHKTGLEIFAAAVDCFPDVERAVRDDAVLNNDCRGFGEANSTPLPDILNCCLCRSRLSRPPSVLLLDLF